ncbi:MAG: hypothetical protein GY716_14535 [bacterium]|nr:hypothetical protein [bacterium]
MNKATVAASIAGGLLVAVLGFALFWNPAEPRVADESPRAESSSATHDAEAVTQQENAPDPAQPVEAPPAAPTPRRDEAVPSRPTPIAPTPEAPRQVEVDRTAQSAETGSRGPTERRQSANSLPPPVQITIPVPQDSTPRSGASRSGSAGGGGGASRTSPGGPSSGRSGSNVGPPATAGSFTAGAPANRSADEPTPPAEGSGQVDPLPAETAEQPEDTSPERVRRSDDDDSEPPENSADPVVRMLVRPPQASIGDTVSVTMLIDFATDVGHAPFHLLFNPAVLRFEQGSEGPFLGSDGNPTAFFAAPSSAGGAVVVGLSRLGRVPGVSGQGELCTLQFTAIGSGPAGLAFSRAKVRAPDTRILESAFLPAALTVD